MVSLKNIVLSEEDDQYVEDNLNSDHEHGLHVQYFNLSNYDIVYWEPRVSKDTELQQQQV